MSVYKWLKMIFTCFILLLFSCEAKNSQLRDLFAYVFNNYDRNVKPVNDLTKPTPVVVDTYFYGLLRVDDSQNVVTLSGLFDVLWRDEFLVWNDSNFSTISEIYTPAEKVWLPELSIFENVEGAKDASPFGKVELKSNGQIEYRVPFTHNILCGIEVRYFPWDRQTCVFHLGPSNRYTSEFEIVKARNPILENFIVHDEWENVKATSRPVRKNVSAFDAVPDANDFQSVVEYTVTMDRNPQFYIYTLIIPSFIITLGAIIAIFAPFNAKGARRAKPKDGTSAFMALLMLNMTVYNKLPQGGKEMALVSIYLFSILMLITSAMCIGTLIIWLEQRPTRKLLPWAKRFFLVFLAPKIPFQLQLKPNRNKVNMSTLLEYYMKHKKEVPKLEVQTDKNDNKEAPNNNTQTKDNQDIMESLRSIVGQWSMVTDHVTNEMKKEQGKADWFNFLLVVERLFFFGFLFILILFLILLFNHKWWY